MLYGRAPMRGTSSRDSQAATYFSLGSGGTLTEFETRQQDYSYEFAIRYDTINYIYMRPKADQQPDYSLPHRTNKQLETVSIAEPLQNRQHAQNP